MRPGPLRRLSLLAAVAVAAVIVALTLVVSPGEGDTLSRLLPSGFTLTGTERASDVCLGGVPCQDGHALAFLALSLFAAVHVATSPAPAERLRPMARLLVVLVAFATFDEAAQRWAGRDPSFADWLADLGGILLGMVLGVRLARALLRR